MNKKQLLKIVAEYQDLDAKIQRLNNYMKGKGRVDIAYYQYELLEVQRGAMEQYARVLRMRIELNDKRDLTLRAQRQDGSYLIKLRKDVDL